MWADVLAHRTSPIVKLTDLFHFTNSYPYDAILEAIDASCSLGVYFEEKFQTLAKKVFW